MSNLQPLGNGAYRVTTPPPVVTRSEGQPPGGVPGTDSTIGGIMTNYPDGMTTRDWAHVNGPRGEYTETLTVAHSCDEYPAMFVGDVAAGVTVGEITRTLTWTCPQCGAEVEDEEELETDDGDY